MAALPKTVSANAWTGDESPTAELDKRSYGWGLTRHMAPDLNKLVPPRKPELTDWRHAGVGWGLILADDDTLPENARATGDDAPEPIRELLAARPGSPVLRYRAELGDRFLKRYYPDGSSEAVEISSGKERGTAPGALPYYLLIYGAPDAVPWSLQYMLNLPCFVGRLDLEGAALEHYVDALINGWPAANCDPHRPVVWSVDHGGDITTLMRQAIAEPLAAALTEDTDIAGGLSLLAGSDATHGALMARLQQQQPALIVTTSHGQTGPLSDKARMLMQLGLLVDNQHLTLDLDSVLAQWQPDGAIWYAHACCSAGCDRRNSYKGLVPAGSTLDNLLDGIAGLGAHVAPLPRRLLGAEKPLRAFIGHVEPTFDWTIQQPETGHKLTRTTVEALYNNLHIQQPVGMAFNPGYKLVGELFQQWQEVSNRFASAATAEERDLIRLLSNSAQLAALDRQSLVILGDPTVVMPAL